MKTQASVAAGTYEVDRARFEAGRELFLREQYQAARDEWSRADPARRDARTQFYVAYSFYRQGWGRVYTDDALFRQGLDGVLVTPGDVPQIRAAMSRLVSEDAARLAAGRSARERARAFDVHVYARRLADLYQRIAPVAEMKWNQC